MFAYTGLSPEQVGGSACGEPPVPPFWLSARVFTFAPAAHVDRPGLPACAQVDALLARHDVYLTRDGRMSIAGLTGADVPYVARAILDVTA